MRITLRAILGPLGAFDLDPAGAELGADGVVNTTQVGTREKIRAIHLSNNQPRSN